MLFALSENDNCSVCNHCKSPFCPVVTCAAPVWVTQRNVNVVRTRRRTAESNVRRFRVIGSFFQGNDISLQGRNVLFSFNNVLQQHPYGVGFEDHDSILPSDDNRNLGGWSNSLWRKSASIWYCSSFGVREGNFSRTADLQLHPNRASE